MRGDQLSRQWRILRTIESKKHGTTVAELALQEDCSPGTIWRDLAVIQNAQLPLLFQFNPMRDSRHRREVQLATRDLQREAHSMTMGVGGLVDVMSWVMGFDKGGEVLEPAHLREAVAQELADTAHRYVEDPLRPPDLKQQAKEKIISPL